MQFSKELAAWRGMLGGYFEFLYLAEKPVSRKKQGGGKKSDSCK
ncbi:hypothetical protein [Methylomonas sp.]|jgi:hypothetical protein|nr:hypothetical protein [Methylomonas sp.]